MPSPPSCTTKPRLSLFATHHFELTEFPGRPPRRLNVTSAHRKARRDIVFLHAIESGPGQQELWSPVAPATAGMPTAVVNQARHTCRRARIANRAPAPGGLVCGGPRKEDEPGANPVERRRHRISPRRRGLEALEAVEGLKVEPQPAPADHPPNSARPTDVMKAMSAPFSGFAAIYGAGGAV